MIEINYKTELFINNNLGLNINFCLEEIKLDIENLNIMFSTKAVVVIKKKNCISWSFITYTLKNILSNVSMDNNDRLSLVTEVNYLGLAIDKNLNWKKSHNISNE